jgi:hypothetical protein
LFRRMVFNGLISNIDLTPNSPVSLERRDLALICGNAGRYANAENMLSQSARFLLSEAEARDIIPGMERCFGRRSPKRLSILLTRNSQREFRPLLETRRGYLTRSCCRR